MLYQALNRAVFERIPHTAQTLLDVGCGVGSLGAAVKAYRPCSVVGLTVNEVEAQQARQVLDRVEQVDLNHSELMPALGQFDCIVCSHVLEHLTQPLSVLAHLRACLRPGGCLIVALPNVLFWKQRLEFVRGRFRYTEGGLMDSTHYRFFDLASAEAMIGEAGFKILERCADGGVPLSHRLGARLGGSIDRVALARFPGMFGFQFVWRCLLPDSAALCQREPAHRQAPCSSSTPASAALASGASRFNNRSSSR